MRVLSVAVHEVSRHPPPMPTHTEDDSARLAVCWVAVGTLQSAEIWVKGPLPGSNAPWLYPDQLLDWLAFTAMIGPSVNDAPAAAGPMAHASAQPRDATRPSLRIRIQLSLLECPRCSGAPGRPAGGQRALAMYPHMGHLTPSAPSGPASVQRRVRG